MLFKEIIRGNSENYTKPINPLCGQNAQIEIFEAGGTLCATKIFFFSVPVCAITASGVPGGTLVSMNRFSTLCG
jgi:hypothetical protein